MRNLFVFIWKNHFFFLFLTLEILAFSMIIRNNYYPESVYFQSANQITGSVSKTWNQISDYFHLKETNKKLAQEITRLTSHLPQNYIVSDRSVFYVNDTLYKQQYSFINAKVIKNTVNKRNNYIMLDKGYRQGVKKDMGVICSNGVAGIVSEVSANFSVAISVLHKESRISAKLKKNNQKGILIWEGPNYRYGKLTDIPAHVDVKKGDTLVTSGNSLIFPEGLLIGFVDDFSMNKEGSYFHITVRFSADYNNLSYVSLVYNLYRNEQLQLEQKSQRKE